MIRGGGTQNERMPFVTPFLQHSGSASQHSELEGSSTELPTVVRVGGTLYGRSGLMTYQGASGPHGVVPPSKLLYASALRASRFVG